MFIVLDLGTYSEIQDVSTLNSGIKSILKSSFFSTSVKKGRKKKDLKKNLLAWLGTKKLASKQKQKREV